MIAVPHEPVADEAEEVIDDATAGRGDVDSRRCSRQRAVLIRSVQLRSVVRACPVTLPADSFSASILFYNDSGHLTGSSTECSIGHIATPLSIGDDRSCPELS